MQCSPQEIRTACYFEIYHTYFFSFQSVIIFSMLSKFGFFSDGVCVNEEFDMLTLLRSQKYRSDGSEIDTEDELEMARKVRLKFVTIFSFEIFL